MSRKDFSYALAFAHAKRVLRHYKRFQKYVGAVIIPDGANRIIWDVAVNDVITGFDDNDPDKRIQSYKSHCVSLTSVKNSGYQLPKPERYPYVYVVSRSDREAFRGCQQTAALDFVEEPDFDVKTTAYCVKKHTGQTLDVADVVRLLSLTDEDRELIVRKGRSVTDLLEKFLLVGAAAVKLDDKPEVKAGPKLSELSGYGDAKTWGMELARDISDYRAGEISWQDVDAGLLLSGPPGTGKTTYAAALARECGVNFVTGSYSTWQSTGHQGDMLKAMRLAFTSAREAAPCVFFVDEIDSFTDRDRDTSDNGYLRGVVNGLLEEMDGAEGLEGVVIIAACNNPDVIDPAVKRSGRLDRHIQLELPDRDARVDILYYHLAGAVDKLELGLTTRQTAGLSGADLERVARDARRLARRERVPLSVKHVARSLPALEDVPKDYIRYTALHEAGHAVISAVLDYGILESVNVLHRRRRGEDIAGGCVVEFPGYVRNTRSHLEDVVCGLLGGMAVEQLVYGEHGSGSFDDLRQATSHAVRMTLGFGMNGRMLSMMQNDNEIQRLLEADRTLQEDVDAILNAQLVRAKMIVAENLNAVHAIAAELEEREVILGSLVLKIVENRKRKNTRAITM